MMKMDLKKRGQRGGALIEFAIILPVLLVLLLGISELGFLFYNKAMITNASREGARAAIVYDEPRLDEAAITTVVNNYCQDHLITFGSATPVTDAVPDNCPAAAASGASITVTVDYQYDWLVLPNLKYATSLAGFSPVNLSATTVMRCE
jgi:Flp pilus assembly protein TadG